MNGEFVKLVESMMGGNQTNTIQKMWQGLIGETGLEDRDLEEIANDNGFDVSTVEGVTAFAVFMRQQDESVEPEVAPQEEGCGEEELEEAVGPDGFDLIVQIDGDQAYFVSNDGEGNFQIVDTMTGDGVLDVPAEAFGIKSGYDLYPHVVTVQGLDGNFFPAQTV